MRRLVPVMLRAPAHIRVVASARCRSTAVGQDRPTYTTQARSLRQRVPGRGWEALSGDAASSSAPFSWPAYVRQSVLLGFYPRGYPNTVAGSYDKYVVWTSIGLLTGRIQSVLATQAALFAAGLGAGTIPMAVAVQWVLKDGVGHLGAIAYASSVNTRFDADAKRYRFHSTCALTVADFISVMMPLAPQHFFLLASVSSTTSSIANLAQVAARARIMSSFALKGNLADCVRAGQTQSKLMSILGTATGASLSWIIGPEPLHVMALMAPLAAISVYSMHASSSVVVLRTFNEQRAERVYSRMLQAIKDRKPVPHGQKAHAHPDEQLIAPSPESISKEETFVLQYRSVLAGEMLMQPLFRARPHQVDAGPAASSDLNAALPALVGAASSSHAAWTSGAWSAAYFEGFAIAAYRAAEEPPRGQPTMRVALWHMVGATAESKIRAVWHACVLRDRLGLVNAEGPPVSLLDEIQYANREADAAWSGVREALLAAHWDLTHAHLDGEGGSLDFHSDDAG